MKGLTGVKKFVLAFPAIKNPPLASYCGAINVISRSILETPVSASLLPV